MHAKPSMRNRHRGPEYVEYQFQRWNGRGPLLTIIAVQVVVLIATIVFADNLPVAPAPATLSLDGAPQVSPR